MSDHLQPLYEDMDLDDLLAITRMPCKPWDACQGHTVAQALSGLYLGQNYADFQDRNRVRRAGIRDEEGDHPLVIFAYAARDKSGNPIVGKRVTVPVRKGKQTTLDLIEADSIAVTLAVDEHRRQLLVKRPLKVARSYLLVARDETLINYGEIEMVQANRC